MNLKLEYDYDNISALEMMDAVRIFENKLKELDKGIVLVNFQVRAKPEEKA